MTNRAAPALAKWPFIVGDLFLLLVAGWIVNRSPDPFAFWPLFFLVACVAGGGWITVYPFLAEHRAAVRMAESEGLHEAAAKINHLHNLAEQIGHATGQWQDIQNQATQTASAAKGITEQMAAEAKAFAEFMQKTNDSEKAHLRLEVEKLRRSESDWVQTLVMLMDHVYGIFAAAVRSGKQTLIDQLAQYQRACREVVRRVGLVPVEAAPGEPYQEQSHELADQGAPMPDEPVVAVTLATGYTYQGKLIRKPLVSLRQPSSPEPDSGDLFQLESETVSPGSFPGAPSEKDNPAEELAEFEDPETLTEPNEEAEGAPQPQGDEDARPGQVKNPF